METLDILPLRCHNEDSDLKVPIMIAYTDRYREYVFCSDPDDLFSQMYNSLFVSFCFVVLK